MGIQQTGVGQIAVDIDEGAARAAAGDQLRIRARQRERPDVDNRGRVTTLHQAEIIAVTSDGEGLGIDAEAIGDQRAAGGHTYIDGIVGLRAEALDRERGAGLDQLVDRDRCVARRQ